MEGIIFGFHKLEPKYDVVELLLHKNRSIHEVNRMLSGKRYAFRKSEHSVNTGSSKGKFVVDEGNGRIVRLIVWTRFGVKTRLTCEMIPNRFSCPDFSRDEIDQMNSVKKFDMADHAAELSYDQAKELVKRCGRIVREFRWTPTIRLRTILYRLVHKYIFDDYYNNRTVFDREKALVFIAFPGLPRDIYEHVFKFLDPASYETLQCVP